MKTNTPTKLQALNWERASKVRACHGILGLLKLILSRSPLDKNVQADAKQVRKQTQDLLAVINANYRKESAELRIVRAKMQKKKEPKTP